MVRSQIIICNRIVALDKSIFKLLSVAKNIVYKCLESFIGLAGSLERIMNSIKIVN